MDIGADNLAPPAWSRPPPPTLVIESLDVYEANGGHTLRRHVDPAPCSDADRLAHEPHIHAAGTFADKPTAQWVVETTVREHQPEVLGWLGHGAPGTLVLGAVFTNPVGSELTREAWLHGQTTPAAARGARVVLRRCDSLAEGFYVLTAYPVLAFMAFAALPYDLRGGGGMPSRGRGNSIDVEATRSLPARDLPALWQLLGGAFHQDWALLDPTWEAAVDAWRRESPPEVRRAAAAEIAGMLAQPLDDAELGALLQRQFGCDVSPAFMGMTNRVWLLAVEHRVGRPE